MVNVIAHEVAEAATGIFHITVDPTIWSWKDPLKEYGGENADFCSWDWKEL